MFFSVFGAFHFPFQISFQKTSRSHFFSGFGTENKSGFVAGFDDFPVFGTFHFPFKIPFIQFQNRTFFSFGAEF